VVDRAIAAAVIDPPRLVTLGIMQLVWGLLPILALVIVDIQVRRVDWLAWPLWLWIGLFVMTSAMGVGMLRMTASESVHSS